MAPCGSFMLFSIAVLLELRPHALHASQVQLKGNGYEGVVIAINPAVPENEDIIAKIKGMVTDASFYMFNATHRRFFFKDVKILIPKSWTPKNYQKRKHESYEKADVIVADFYVKYGDDPYTLQYGGCGQPGKYIHLTPNFLLNDDLIDVYGLRGRLFVHEWAHLRWGVFDEYNIDKPFYISGQNKLKATRCSTDIQGMTVCNGEPCAEKDCIKDPNTGEVEEGCQFIPEKEQSAKTSIMYMQALPSVVDFCDENSHDTEVPHLQNKMCNYQSTWAVIKASADFKATSPMGGTDLPAPPSFSLLQIKERVVCLVLDVSGSMSLENRINRMRQAAELFILQIVEVASHVGIVTFNSGATIKAHLTKITDDNSRKQLIANLPTIAAGGTNICSGVRTGFEVVRKLDGNTNGAEIVLLTDGEDSGMNSCFADVASSGATIHTIALGPKAAAELEKLADMTEGFKFSAKDTLDSNGLIDAFSGIADGSGLIALQSIQLESAADEVEPGMLLSGIVAIDQTVGNDTFFTISWHPNVRPPGIKVTDPNNKVYTLADFVQDPVLHAARLQIPGTAQPGEWTYTFNNTLDSSQVFSLVVTSRAANANVPPVIVNAQLSQDTVNFPNPMVVYADVRQGFSPVLGANVTAVIELEFGNPVTLHLVDDGAGADIAKNDGIYSKFFHSYNGNGRYNLKVRVSGKNNVASLSTNLAGSRALYIPGYIVNGTIKMNPPRPTYTDNSTMPNLGTFTRIASGGTFFVSSVPSGPLPDVFPPCKIVDLEARAEEFIIYLTWTAPGGDFDEGQASSYSIKMSDSPAELRDNFDNATSLNISFMIPKPAGSRETFVYVPELEDKANNTILYFAMRATDNSSLVSQLSNVAQVVIVVPRTDLGRNDAKNRFSCVFWIFLGSAVALFFVVP
ncbi:calcium-activated chloride channel regulator 1-like [Ambystoma mexicanum]|uniref:calcium-activated chloride channel regulator 1-like n=1 Tax=Ambystoma mexicanum TaxID=8296 RepID=UPI0037E75CCB